MMLILILKSTTHLNSPFRHPLQYHLQPQPRRPLPPVLQARRARAVHPAQVPLLAQAVLQVLAILRPQQ